MQSYKNICGKQSETFRHFADILAYVGYEGVEQSAQIGRDSRSPPALPCRAEKRRTAACGVAVLAGYEVICYQPLIFTMVAMRSSTLLE